MKKISIIIAIAICVMTLLASCGPVSLIKPAESTTKKAFDEAEFDEEFYRTSVPEETTAETTSGQEETSESEPAATTAPAETKAGTTAPAVSSTAPAPGATSSPATTSTTKVSLIPARESTTKKTVVDTKIETKEKKSDYKYGVKKIDVESVYYDIYSDGSKVQTDKKSYVKYDTSGYKATTSDLLSEAKSNKLAYASDIRGALSAVNSGRDKELALDDSLCEAACVRAAEMAYSGKLSSTRPGGAKYSTVLRDLDIKYTNCIELTCKGYSSGSEAANAWLSDSGSKSAINKAEYTKVGIGAAKSPDGIVYWCLILSD